MSFIGKIRAALIRFMQGRYGADALGIVTMWTGLFLNLAGALSGVVLLSALGLALYAITLWRMLSRKVAQRSEENRRFAIFVYKARMKVKQFFLRLRNARVYKYFRCPRCRVLIRLKRGSGQRQIHCPKCGHDFTRKA